MSLTPIDSSSPNHNARPPGQPIDILLLHYTGMESAEAALARLCDPAAKVSAHYLIEEDGRLHRLVAEERRAWHAGVASWAGESDINGCSIGIELVNPGHEFGYQPFPEAQMQTLEALGQEILARHRIPPQRVLGHSDVAPLRKTDPGEKFPWSRLAAAGIGLWPKPEAVPPPEADEIWFRDGLARFGYGFLEDDLAAVVSAFQRRFRPQKIDGKADSDCFQLLAGLLDWLDAESPER